MEPHNITVYNEGCDKNFIGVVGGSKGNFGELWESPPRFLKFPKKKFPKTPQNSPKLFKII